MPASNAGRNKRARKKEMQQEAQPLTRGKGGEESGKMTTRATARLLLPRRAPPSKTLEMKVEEIERRGARDGTHVKEKKEEKGHKRSTRAHTCTKLPSMPKLSPIAKSTTRAAPATRVKPCASPVKRKRCGNTGTSVASPCAATDRTRASKLKKPIRFATSNDVHFSPSMPVKARARVHAVHTTERVTSSMKGAMRKARVQKDKAADAKRKATGFKRKEPETKRKEPNAKRKTAGTQISHRKNEKRARTDTKTYDEKKVVDTKTNTKKQKKQNGQEEKEKVVKKNGELDRLRNRVKGQLSKIRLDEAFVEAYSGEGWKGARSCWTKVGLSATELQAAHRRITGAKASIAAVVSEIEAIVNRRDKGVERFPRIIEYGKADDEEAGRSHGMVHTSDDKDDSSDDDGIDLDDIVCVECGRGDDDEHNDIVLCDGICGRAFHQMCVDPPLLVMPDEDDAWLCPACAVKEAVVMDINHQFETEYDIDTKPEDMGVLFGECAAKTSEADHAEGKEAAACSGGSGDATFLNADFPSDDEDDDEDFTSSDEEDEEEDGEDNVGESEEEEDEEDEDEDAGQNLEDFVTEFGKSGSTCALGVGAPSTEAVLKGGRTRARSGGSAAVTCDAPTKSPMRSPLRIVHLSTVNSPRSVSLNRVVSPPPKSAASKPVDAVCCGRSSRRRTARAKVVDYRALSLELFGSLSAHDDEEDNEWAP